MLTKESGYHGYGYFKGYVHPLTEAREEIKRHHKDFESISAVSTLVRNGQMSAEEGMKIIQGIVG